MTEHRSAASCRAQLPRWAGRVLLLACTGAGLWLLGCLGSTASAEQVPSPPALTAVTAQFAEQVTEPVVEQVAAPVVEHVTTPVIPPVQLVVAPVEDVVRQVEDAVEPAVAPIGVRVEVPVQASRGSDGPTPASTVVAPVAGPDDVDPVVASAPSTAAPVTAAPVTAAPATAVQHIPSVPAATSPAAEPLPALPTPLDLPVSAPTPATSSAAGPSSPDQTAAVLASAARAPLDSSAARTGEDPPGSVAGSPFDPTFSPD